MDYLKLLDDVETIALRAGQVILDLREAAKRPIIKPDGSPVTEADQAADRFITTHLQELTPDIPIVSEEGVADGIIPDVAGGTFWLVDPLDGTRQFIEGTDEYSVALALVVNHRVQLGLFHYPEKSTIYGAAGPGTAFYKSSPEAAKKKLKPRTPDLAALDIIVATKKELKEKEFSQFLENSSLKARSIESRIGFEKFYLVADGHKDLYIRLHPVHEWDVAPGHALLDGAGGRTQTLYGAPLVYGNYGQRMAPFVAHAGVEFKPLS